MDPFFKAQNYFKQNQTLPNSYVASLLKQTGNQGKPMHLPARSELHPKVKFFEDQQKQFVKTKMEAEVLANKSLQLLKLYQDLQAEHNELKAYCRDADSTIATLTANSRKFDTSMQGRATVSEEKEVTISGEIMNERPNDVGRDGSTHDCPEERTEGEPGAPGPDTGRASADAPNNADVDAH